MVRRDPHRVTGQAWPPQTWLPAGMSAAESHLEMVALSSRGFWHPDAETPSVAADVPAVLAGTDLLAAPVYAAGPPGRFARLLSRWFPPFRWGPPEVCETPGGASV